MSTPENRTTDQIRSEIETERGRLSGSLDTLRVETAVVVGEAKRAATIGVAVFGTLGLLRALLKLRRG